MHESAVAHGWKRLWFKLTPSTSVAPAAVGAGLLLLRVSTGMLTFVIHGWHKLAAALAYIREDAQWPLVDEIAAMGLPRPALAAFGATVVQSVAALLLVVGLRTRIAGAFLTAVLLGAVIQNLLSGRDPQLALLYTANAAVLMLIGGGCFSIDAVLARKPGSHS